MAALLCLPPLPAGLLQVPGALDPFAPLNLRAAPNLLTRFKLGRLEGDERVCLRQVAAAGLGFPRVPDRPSAVGCPIRDAVRVQALAAGFVASCPLAAAWALFEREVLQPEAREHLGARVTSVRHFGSYACRNVNHRVTSRRSEHATANAVDVAAFDLADGREVRVARDWPRVGTREAVFLRAVHEGACRFFDVVLGPAYNAAHRDHFHLDMGRWRACR